MVRNVAQAAIPEEASTEVIIMLEKREQARLQQEWAKADVLRQQIAALGWIVQDTPDGQKIVRQS
jgi:cysteinyl-tRNA synthetase